MPSPDPAAGFNPLPRLRGRGLGEGARATKRLAAVLWRHPPHPTLSPQAGGEGGFQASGFTLLEVLIAFVIASLAIAALFSGTAGGLDATAVAAKYDEAISLARSHLAAIGHGEAIHLVETSGAEGEDFTWHLRVRAAGTRQLNLSDQDRANDIKATAAVLYDVVVTESWKSGGRTRQITLATRRFDTVQGDSP